MREKNGLWPFLKSIYKQPEDQLANVKRFGAKGDGSTDDTEALLEALRYSIEHGKTAFLPKGIYLVQPNAIRLELRGGQVLQVAGEGEESVLKRKDWTTVADWQVMMMICADASNKADVRLIRFSNLKLDGNARNQQAPPMHPYDYEHCADLCIHGSAHSYIAKVEMENIFADDGVADHLYIAGMENAYVRQLDIDGFSVSSRSRMRSDICVTGGIETATIRNIVCKSLEYEFNAPYEKGLSKLKLDNIVTDNLDLTGADKDLEVRGTNITSGHTYLGDLSGLLSNCTLTFEAREKLSPDEGRLYNLENFVISDSKLLLTPVGGKIVPFRLTHKNKLLFKNVSFVIDDPREAFQGNLLEFEPTDAAGTLVQFYNCTFDDRADTAFRLNRCGTVEISSCVLNNPNPFRFYSSCSYPLQVKLCQIELGEKCRNSFWIEGGEGLSLNVRNFVCAGQNFAILAENSSWSAYDAWSVERDIHVDPAASNQFSMEAPEEPVILSKGDKFIGRSNQKTAVWEVTKTAEFRMDQLVANIRKVSATKER
jgi:hypothetical protein